MSEGTSDHGAGPGAPPPAPGAETGERQAGENTCPDCSGTGRADGGACGTCGGGGRVVELVGDA